MTEDPEGEALLMDNSVLATGVVMGCLWGRPGVTRCEPVMVNGEATNVLKVEFDFLKSTYRVTVEIMP
jgi:hypothetical protein